MNRFSRELNGKYEGLTLIEMVITLLIVSIILIVVSSTLTALIKASAIASARTLSRDESEFVLELLEKEMRNASSENVYVYNLPTERVMNDSGEISEITVDEFNTSEVTTDGSPGNEIHFKPQNDSAKFRCLGIVKMGSSDATPDGETFRMIVRSEATSVADTPDVNCLSNDNRVVITSDEVNILKFSIKKFSSGDMNSNLTFVVDLSLKPVYWVSGKQSKYKPEYSRQMIVSTGKLTF